MKTAIVIFLIILLSSCVPLPAQDYLCGKNKLGMGQIRDVSKNFGKNSISIDYQTGDNGIGVRLGRKISSRVGMYLVGTKGGYYRMGKAGEIPQYKLAMGTAYYVLRRDKIQGFASFGVSSHWYKDLPSGTMGEDTHWSAKYRYSNFSCEVGWGMEIGKHIQFAATYDPFHDQFNPSLGYIFNL